MKLDFSGRVILITGASGGIGRAIAEVFCDAGAKILLADIRESLLREVAKSIDPTSERTVVVKYDAVRPEHADHAVNACVDRFGRLDYLVPAAAIFEDQPFHTMTDEQWRRTISINLDGVFFICRRAIPFMSEGSSIVTIASEAAHMGSSIGHCHYGASKGGVLTLTRSLARELAPRIRVNTVSPGTIDTPMVQSTMQTSGKAIMQATPMARLGTTHEVANVVAFLCSDSASYVTGQAIHVNGGSYIGG